jgi:hypothetical protein
MVRGESHRATYRMHHFQPSGIYETGSRRTAHRTSNTVTPAFEVVPTQLQYRISASLMKAITLRIPASAF